MILIEVKDGHKLIGRCDAKCYDAADDRCVCICCGKNHRKGLKQALENTKENGEQWLDDFCRNRNNEKTLALDISSLQRNILHENVDQMKLL